MANWGDRVALVFDNVQKVEIIRGDSKKMEDCPPARQVVEHTVLLNMPFLQGDQEAQVLQGLYNLQFEFDNILQLSVGRVLNEQAFCTHALILRFPTIQVLLEYYRSEALSSITAKLLPHINGEYTVDYLASVPDNSGSKELTKLQSGLEWTSLTFLKAKENLRPGTVDNIIQSLLAVPKQLDYVKELTVGSSLFARDQTFSHTFAVYLKSAKDLERLLKEPCYADVIQDKVLPASSKTVSVKFLAYKPILSGL